MVLSGKGSVTYEPNAWRAVVQVDGTPNSYRPLATPGIQAGVVTVTVSPGARACSFTFG